jgi:photosystem II stability/assembly factor-like uncharacterized protein
MLLFLLTIIIILNSILELNAQWQKVNLGPAGGEINSVAVIGGNVFAAANAGINRSTNNGVTWTNVNSSLTSCFAPIGSNILAGTSSGVIISTDSGSTWSGPNPGMPYWTVAFAVRDTMIFAATDNGIYLSTNNGTSWTDINKDQNTVDALAVIGTNIYAGTGSGLLLSTDNGYSWSNIATSDYYSNQQMNCIAGNDSTIFVGTPGQLLIDKDNSWGIADIGLNYGTSILSILVNNSDVFIGTTNGVYISTNNGGSWTAASNGMPVPPKQVYSIAASPTGAGGTNLYAATNNGVYLSTNDGVSWTPENNGTVGTDVYSITGSGSKIFAAFGLNNTSIFFSTDYGLTWNTSANSGLGAKLIYNLTIIDSGLYATSDYGLFLSSNDGENWSSIDGAFMDTVVPYDIVQSGSNLVVSTQNYGIYYSSNNGASWNKAGGFNTQIVPVLSVIGSKVFSESANGMYLSTDNGENWVELNDTLTNEGLFVGILSIGSTLFAVNEGEAHTVNGDEPTYTSLNKSTDNGITWNPVSITGMPPYFLGYIYSLIVNGSDIFVAINDRVYGSIDSGNNWNNISHGLPGGEILTLFANDSSVFAGDPGSGIWRLPLSDIVTVVKQPVLSSSPKSSMLWQNYPNPFNPSTIISYDISKLSHVTINIYDILGRKVETLVDAERLPGHYQVTFNASRITSGVYFYRITAGSFVQTKKLMVIK